VERHWQHLSFFEHACYLHCAVPRIITPDGKVVTVVVPWARPGSGFTLLFEALALALIEREMPVNRVAELLRVNPQRIWTVNGVSGPVAGDRFGKPILSVKRGTPIVLAMTNRTAFPQAIHIHGHSFRLLHSFDDGWEPYWLDTMILLENQTQRITFVADNSGRWLIGSTVLERLDTGLSCWFEVT
jgi:hypothetical protein